MGKKARYNDPIEGVKLEETGKPAENAEAVEAVESFESAPAKIASFDAPAPVSRAKKYRVKARTHVSLMGQIIVLNADDIISSDSYGDVGLARLLESVPVEELR